VSDDAYDGHVVLWERQPRTNILNTQFTVIQSRRMDTRRTLELQKHFDEVKRNFGITFDAKHEQLLVAESILKGRHVLGLLPTGFGKTFCAVLPTLLTTIDEPVTLIISPLSALIDDQIQIFKNWGFSATKLEPEMDMVVKTG